MNLLEKIVDFTGISLTEISNKNFSLTPSFREELVQRYKNTQFEKIISKPPQIVYAINNELLKSEFFEIFRETNEIKKFFVEFFGWDYKGTSITNALLRNKEVEVKTHHSKGKTNLYRAKRN